MDRLYNIVRYLVSFLIMFYGFAKLNGAQFTVLDSVVDKPMGEVDGFWLTWYYFGYSSFYGNLIALIQIIAGIGLLFRRTTLVAGMVLMAVMGNILLVDYFFKIPMQGSVVAIIITLLLLFILYRHLPQIIDFFWNWQAGAGKEHTPGRWLLRAVVIVIPALFTYYVANYNNRHPTPLDGRWIVAHKAAAGTEYDSLQRVYFERNRAFMVVFKYPNSWQTHQFNITGDTVTIREGYLKNGPEKLRASFRITEGQLQVVDSQRNVLLWLRKS